MLSTNEVRARAAQFARDWKAAAYEKGETQTFYNEFFEVFGVKRRQLASFEKRVLKHGGKPGFIDLFWPGLLLVEQKSAGRNLTRAKDQAFDYFPGIKPAELPRFVLLSDFQTFELHDLDHGTEVRFALHELSEHIEAFDFIRGREKREYKDQDPVNVAASELLGKLHDQLEASGYTGHDLERFLVRLVFCLFADDTGIFDPRDVFTGLIETRTREDGSDTGLWLAQLFQVLNTPLEKRQKNLDEDLAAFPYVNGDLFSGHLQMPSFDATMRALLLEACQFDWAAISPAIFGALFQSVMDTKERRQKGAHYTSEQNILKVIEPLFMEDLRAEFEHLRTRKDTHRRSELLRFHDRLASLKFLDPACGCGNFLIIAYRQLRRLELELLLELRKDDKQRLTDVTGLSKIDVDQFYGIEIEEFSARIAEIALWMMDHIMNNELSQAFGLPFVRIPLRKSATIAIGNALRLDWDQILPAENCSYLFGNPPFVGQKTRTADQTDDLRRVWGDYYARWLDYVSGWYKKGADYVLRSAGRAAYVSTNSITQGEQVARMWRPLLASGIEIDFAHRTFNWSSEARGRAYVHCVIIGFSPKGSTGAKRLFDYDDIDGEPAERRVERISPYLIAGPDVLVDSRSEALSPGLPPALYGNKPADGGHLIVDDDDRPLADPIAMKYLRRYIGTDELLYNTPRWCLWLLDASPAELAASPFIRDRVAKVRAFRAASTAKDTRAYADQPTRFFRIPQPKTGYIAIPRHVSENRRWFTVGHMRPEVIASDALFTAVDVDGFLFGLLSSAMFISWLRTVGGTLESRLRFSGLVYNSFPVPEPTPTQRLAAIEAGAEVLAARAAYPDSNLAQLYDPLWIPGPLVLAHQRLDRAVERCYRSTKFNSDGERVEHLFERYEKLVAPLLGQVVSAKGKRSTKKK